jgi:hypothetical protein
MDFYEADNFTTELVQDAEPQGVELQLQAAGKALARELSAFSKAIPWSGINRFFSEAVGAIDSGILQEPQSELALLFDSGEGLVDDADERILHLMASPALFLRLDNTCSDWKAFEQFDETFSVEENEEEITHLQEHCPELCKTMQQLVPGLLTQDQAWARFFFLSAQIRLGRAAGVGTVTADQGLSTGYNESKRLQHGSIQLTSSFETVKVSETNRSMSQRSDASYDFVSRQHSPTQSASDLGISEG